VLWSAYLIGNYPAKGALTMTLPDDPTVIAAALRPLAPGWPVIDDGSSARQRLVVQRDTRAGLRLALKEGRRNRRVDHRLHGAGASCPSAILPISAKAVEAVRAAAQALQRLRPGLRISDVPTSPHDLRMHVADLTRRAGLVRR